MSHFLGAVVVPPRIDLTLTPSHHPLHASANAELQDYLEEALTPFWDGLQTERYLVASRTELVAAERARIHYFAQPTQDRPEPDPYADMTATRRQYYLDRVTEMAEWTEQQIWAHAVEFQDPEDTDADGSLYSTANRCGFFDGWAVAAGHAAAGYPQGEPVAEFTHRILLSGQGSPFGDGLGKLIYPHRGQFKALTLADHSGWLLPVDNFHPAQGWLKAATRALQTQDPASAIIYVNFHW